MTEREKVTPWGHAMHSENKESAFAINFGGSLVIHRVLLTVLVAALCSNSTYAQNSAVGFVSASVVRQKHDVAHVIAGNFDGNSSVDFVSYGYDWDYDPPTFYATVFLNNSNGTFAQYNIRNVIGEPIDFGRQNPRTGLAIGRVTGGQALDIVETYDGQCYIMNGREYNSAMVVLKGNGDGTFQPGVEYGGSADPNLAGGNIAGPVAIADFNGDGKLDVATGGSDVHVFLGDGKGHFSFPFLERADSTFSQILGLSFNNAAPTQATVAVADFDRNGLPDLVLANPTGVARLYASRVPVVTPGSLIWTRLGTTQTITVRNPRTTAQRIGASIATGPTSTAFQIRQNTCESSIRAGGSCAITVDYVGINNPAFSALMITDNYHLVAEVPLSGRY